MKSLKLPPLWIVSVPVPEMPTKTVFACAPAAPTTVALGATVSIFTSTALVGTPADQLPAVNQSVEVAPVQSVARDGVDVARTSPSATMELVPSRRRDNAAKVSAAKLLIDRWRPTTAAPVSSAPSDASK
ncbi:hypothetical protein M2175_005571 [Bradyrhizobium elkanii]|uniref:hypothetical protein n=1 Tax=Bradyrhizobium TaxID=374 RepID=UPI002167AFF7|nr:MULTISPECIES: hypothetical protein [Bradyrhizobium]MCS3930540.1 hypothetical protein [Bradyrhizobium elkanii]MCS3971097.1 hypothetical protein [Bradyrhizobium japonicum]